MKTKTFFSGVFAAFLITAPYMAHAGNPTASRTDDSITTQIESSLSGLPGRIAVSAENGEVTLIGTVPDTQSMEAAVARARSIAGVVSVTNDLRIASETPH